MIMPIICDTYISEGNLVRNNFIAIALRIQQKKQVIKNLINFFVDNDVEKVNVELAVKLNIIPTI